MSELLKWCQQKAKQRKELLEDLYGPGKKAIPAESGTALGLTLAQSELQSRMSLLVSIQEAYCGKSQWQRLLKSAAGMESTAEYGYHGASPASGGAGDA